MDKYLVINAGSSSLKFSLYEMPSEKLLASGVVERIGSLKSTWKLKRDGIKTNGEAIIQNHSEAFALMKQELLNNRLINEIDEIKGVGHRVLHGATLYSEPAIVDEKLISNMEFLTPYGPLHHPGQVAGMKGAMESFPDALGVAVFDTAFHQSIPKENYMYPIPYEIYKEYGIRKYGFHGTSYQYIVSKLEEKLKRDDVNAIVCHIGSGASIAAIKNSKSFDTTMGVTPLGGLMMCTRSGDLDPSVVDIMMRQTGYSIEQVIDILNKESGLLGVSRISNDFRDVEAAALSGDKYAILAIKLLVKSACETILKYYLELEGKVDALVFTAGIGENASYYRQLVIDKLSKVMPIGINVAKNNKIAGFKEKHEGKISNDTSKFPIYVIPTNEELMIAKSTYELNEKQKTLTKVR